MAAKTRLDGTCQAWSHTWGEPAPPPPDARQPPRGMVAFYFVCENCATERKTLVDRSSGQKRHTYKHAEGYGLDGWSRRDWAKQWTNNWLKSHNGKR